MKTSRIIVLSAVVGCGDNPAPTCIEIDAPLAEYLAVQEVGSEWRQLPIVDGQSEVCVEREYRAIAVCDVPMASRLTVVQVAASPEDGDKLDLGFCSGIRGESVPVSGLMLQAGEVSIGSALDSSFVDNWLFDLDVSSGLHDLVASEPFGSNRARIAIRRGLLIDGATKESPIDLDVEGIDATELPVSVAGLSAADTVDTSVFLETERGGGLVSSRSGIVARTVPPGALVGTDHQYVSISSRDGDALRLVSVDVEQLGMLELPPKLEGILFGEIDAGFGASWANLPVGDFDHVFFTSQSVDDQHVVFIAASKRWLEATGSTSVALDGTAPQFESRWLLSAADEFSSELRLEGHLGPVEFSTAREHTRF